MYVNQQMHIYLGYIKKKFSHYYFKIPDYLPIVEKMLLRMGSSKHTTIQNAMEFKKIANQKF